MGAGLAESYLKRRKLQNLAMGIEFAHLALKLMLLGISTRVSVQAMAWFPTLASRGLLGKL